MKIQVNILKKFILKLENELLFFKENSQFLNKRKMEIAKKYYVGLKINQFLESIRESKKTKDDIRIEYEKISSEVIPDTHLTIGDVFVIYEEGTSSDGLVYGLRTCKEYERYIPQVAGEKIFQLNEAQRTVGEKVIVNCMQIFEEYFSSILKILISMKPDAYFYDKSIKYSLLITKKIEELTSELVNQEVESLMHGVSATIEKVNQTHKLKLEKHQDIWDAYKELDLRRNIIVHNEGKANYQYLSGLPARYSKPQDGTRLLCDEPYVLGAIESLTKFAFLLYYLIAEGREELSFLDSTAFEFLRSEKWNISLFAYDLLLSIPILTNSEKITYQINRLIAKKHVEGPDSVKTEIEQLDISGMEVKFVIAKKLLLEEHEAVNKLLNSSYPESFDFHMIQTWPIFKEYRMSDEYRIFIGEHQEEYAQYELKEPEITTN